MRRNSGWIIALAAAMLWLAAMAIYLSQQEIPTGWLRGKAVAEESGQPLAGIEIRLHPLAAPEREQGDVILTTKRDGTFRSKRIPAGTYSLQATSRAHQLRATSVSVEEGKVQVVSLELSPVPPFFDLRIPRNVFTPDEKPQAIASGFVTGDAVGFTIYRVNAAVLFREKNGELGALLHPQGDWRRFYLDGNPGLTPVDTLSLPITKRDVEGVFRQRFDLPVAEPGIYVIAARADSIQRVDSLVITRIGLLAKLWGDQALAFVADLKTGAPVSGANVEFAVEDGKTITGITDAEGIFQGRIAAADIQFRVLARAEHQGSQAFLRSYVWRGEREGQDRVYAYTDRPVYRPGNEVNFKGIARRYAGADYSVLADKPVEVKVWDPRDSLVHKAALTTNAFGSYHGVFRLNDEAATGYYRVVSTVDGRPHDASFNVAEYRKPEYSVEVKTSKKRYTRGETIRAQVSAEYYFGAPVAGAAVSYTVFRSPYWFFMGGWEEAEYYEGEEYGGYEYGEIVEEGEAETGPDGVAHFTIPTRKPFFGRRKEEQASDEMPSDYTYTISATVTDPSRKEVTAEGSTLVTQGEFKLSVDPRSYVGTPGLPVDVDVTATDYRSRPVAGVQVEVSAQRQVWNGTKSVLQPGTRARVTTDAKGRARFRFTPPMQGSYRIEARARDRRANQIRATSYLWVTSEEFADFGVPYPELEIITDKKVYQEGDTAVLLINTKTKGATALLTVEGAQLYDHRLVQLEGNSTRVELPIKHAYAPNCFVAVAFVHDKEFATQQKRVAVSVEARSLRVEAKANKRRYLPGETITYDLRTTDWRGKPVQAELSLGVVDESIYAIEEESAPPMLSFFYPPRENSVSTVYSFASIYLDADKGAAGIKVRKRFPDTAYWNPTVVTNSDGQASVSFTMPDTLTTWRATVRGATMNTEVGQTVAKVQTFKELLIRLEAPRFMVQRDRLTLSALVHNYTRSRQDLQVGIEAPGLSLRGGRRAAEPQQFSLGPDEVRRQDWEIEVPSPGSREITVYVKARSGLSDAMALTIPALPHGRERVEWRSGAVQTAASERLTIRRDAVAGASDVRVRLAPSIASVMFGALDYLAHYPYGCTEQTMSAFLPDIVVAHALRELKLSNPQLEKQLPDMVQKGFDRLYNYQHEDGGWGWWRYDDSDPWMTAYVVYGLTVAKRSGWEVNERALTQGLEWLTSRLRQPAQLQPVARPYYSGDRLFALYVLALAGSDGFVDQQLTAFYRNRLSLDSYNLALLASALVERGRTKEAKDVVDGLWGRARASQALISWSGRSGWGRGGDFETTGIALKALLAVDPNDPRLPRIVRWLVLNRQGDGWVSTRDTAFVLFALTDYLKQSQELQPDYEATVTLNDKPLLKRHFTRDDLFAPEVEVKASGNALRSGDNTLRLSKAGAGNLYYTLILRQFVGQGDLAEVITGAGITVQRQYYRMTSERDPETGAIITMPSSRPITDFRSGESVLVRLKIATPKEYEYVIVEDPIPAGCEVIERGDVEPWEWDRWWSDMDVRDEKVAIFARRLPAGVSTIEYHLRPQIPGDYHVMPTQVYAMYNPELRGSGAEARIRLR